MVLANRRGYPAFALVRRELLTELRRPRAFAIIFASALIAMSAAALNWPEDVYSLSMAASFATVFFIFFAYGLFAVVVLCLPALSATAIVAEREQETFDFIRMSLVTSTSYVAAKTVNALGLFFTILVGLAPVLGTVFFLAGVDPARMASVLLMLATTGIYVTSISLLSSACFRRTLPAVVGSYAGIVACSLGPVVAMFLAFALLDLMGVGVRSFQAPTEDAFVNFSPLGSFVLTVAGELTGSELVTPICVQLGLSLACLGAAVFRVHHPPAPPRVELAKPIADPALLAARRRKFPYYLIDPLKKRPPVEDKRNPMLVREIRWGLMNRGSMLVRVFYLSAAVYFFAAATMLVGGGSDADTVQWVMTQIVLTLCVAPALLANALTKERELGNIDMLRMTLLRGRDIVFGKLASGAMTLVPVVVAAMLSIIPIAPMIGLGEMNIVAMGYLTLINCSFLALCLSLLASLFAARTSTAIVYAYVLVFMAFFGASLAVILAAYWYLPDGLYSDDPQVQSAGRIAAFLSPILAYTEAAGYNPGERNYDFDYLYWGASMVAAFLIAAASLAFTAWHFERRRMRDK